MNTAKKLLIVSGLSLFFLFWIFFLRSKLEGSFYNFSEWGGYLLVTPLVASLISLLKGTLTNKLILIISLGAMLSIILSTESEIIILCLKSFMILAGACITLVMYKKEGTH